MTKEELQGAVSETVAEEVQKLLRELPRPERKEIEEKIRMGRKPSERLKAATGFLHALHVLNFGDAAMQKDLSISVNANGGYLVPTEFYDELVEKKYKAAYLRRYVTVVPMSSETLQIQDEASDITTNWTTELAAIAQSDMTFGQVTLKANLLGAISRMSRQLLADAGINEGVAQLVIRKFANRLGRDEDTAFFVGTGTGQPKGIRQYSISQTIAIAGSNIAANDLTALIHTLPEQYRVNATFVMHDTALKLVRQLRSTTGELLFQDAWNKSDDTVGTIYGYPVISQNDIPTNLGGGTNATEIWFGDLSYYYVGDREEMSAEISTEEGTSFAQHRAAMKVVERLDGQLTLTESMAFLSGVK